MTRTPLARLHETVVAAPSPILRAGKRERILEAAIRVFARRGYHGARVSDIAREAGIAYGLVYHYFRNKEELLRCVFEERWNALLGDVERIVQSDAHAPEKLLELATRIVSAYRQRPDWVKVLVFEIHRSSRFAEPDPLRAVRRLFQGVARILRTGQQRGELRADLDAEIACFAFVGALEIVITGLVLGGLRADDGPTRHPQDGDVARTVVDLFLNGLAARGAGS